jgi:hypothetical protein
MNLRQFQLVARGGDLLAETQLPDEVVTKPSKPVEGQPGHPDRRRRQAADAAGPLLQAGAAG